MKRIFILFVFVFSISMSDAADYKLKFVLSGKDYDKFLLHLSLLDGRQEQIAGEFDRKDHSWNCVIPESIRNDVAFISCRVWDNEGRNGFCNIDFKYPVSNDTLTVSRFVVDSDVTTIYGTYLRTRTVLMQDYPAARLKNGEDKFSIDNFVISSPESEEWNITAQYPVFSFFSPRNKDEEGFGYYDYLKQYVEVVKKFPDSQSLMNFLVMGRHRYKSAYDLSEVYNEFSENLRTSKAGRILANFIKNDCKF